MTANALAQLGKLATVSTSGTVAAGKQNSFNATSGALVATLPPLTSGAVATALAAGQIVRAKISKSKSDTTANAVTVTCADSDTFESGSTTQVLLVAGEKLTLAAQTVAGGAGPVWVVEEHTAPRDVLDTRFLPQATAAEYIRDTIGATLVPGSNVTLTVDDAGDTITIAATGASGGTVSDATATVKGVLQLAGSLGGTAGAPTVPKFEAGFGYAGVFKGDWAINTVYAINDIVTVQGGVFIAISPHTSGSIADGFGYDRNLWATIQIPQLHAATRVPVRQLIKQNFGTGFPSVPAASVFSQRTKRFNYSAEKPLFAFAQSSDVTVQNISGGGSGQGAATGTQAGGSAILTSSLNTGKNIGFAAAPFAAPIDISDSNLRMQANISASNGQIQLQVTSASGGTDYTNSTTFLFATPTDSERSGVWHGFGCPTSEVLSTSGTGATLTAITGARILLYWSSGAQFTVETQGVKYLKNTATIAKCILWLDDGGYTSHLTAMQLAAKYGFPLTLAYVAANYAQTTPAVSLDMARHIQDGLNGQIAVHAYSGQDHNRYQTGSVLYEQFLSYQHFALATGFTGVEDMAYWSSGNPNPYTNEDEYTVRKLFRSARGGKSRLPETLPPTDPWNTRAIMTGTETAAASWIPYAQRAIAAKGLVQFVWHDQTGSIPTEFANLLAWLDANRSSIQVVTPQQAFNPLCL